MGGNGEMVTVVVDGGAMLTGDGSSHSGDHRVSSVH